MAADAAATPDEGDLNESDEEKDRLQAMLHELEHPDDGAEGAREANEAAAAARASGESSPEGSGGEEMEPASPYCSL
jgi:hypothetical protein